MKDKVGERFSEFFERWLGKLDEYAKQLLSLSKGHLVLLESNGGSYEQELQSVVSKVTQHYKEYYTVKWALAHEDVLAFFSPVWASPLEKAYSWVTGWKPSMVFKLVESMRKTHVPGPSLADLTQEQVGKIEALRVKMRSEEEKVEREMERQQVAIAGTKMVELVRLASRVKNEGAVAQLEGLVGVALNGVMAGLEKVMKAADCVRLRTLKGILDILSPLQCAEFLAGTSMLQIELRRRGKERDSDITNNVNE